MGTDAANGDLPVGRWISTTRTLFTNPSPPPLPDREPCPPPVRSHSAWITTMVFARRIAQLPPAPMHQAVRGCVNPAAQVDRKPQTTYCSPAPGINQAGRARASRSSR
uniref:Uncharacterized protein n=1 Tax=Triticum urartu TaxID=4572 RepID=A0A8R7R6W1_TRIUA